MKKQIERCSAKDYDFYIIPFPLRALPKAQRTKYLYSELGKLHPCFSDDCCFDFHLRLEKSGLKADVVVMQKIRLAELKGPKNQRRIFIEERKYESFFSGSKNAWGLIAIAALFCVVFVVLFFGISKKKEVAEVSEQEIFLSDEKKLNQIEPEYSCFVKDFFEQLDKTGGNIKTFEWKTDGFTENLSARVYGVFPEQLMLSKLSPSFSPVSFANEKPVMTIVVNKKLAGKEFFDSGEKTGVKADVRSLLRKTLCDFNVQILEETVLPYSLKLFFADKGRGTVDSLSNFFAFLNDNKLSLDSLLIVVEETGVKLNCSFSEIFLYSSEPLCKELAEHLSLFGMLPKNKPSPQTVKKETMQKESLQQKVGQLVLQDGQVVEFFKDQNGKIIKR